MKSRNFAAEFGKQVSTYKKWQETQHLLYSGEIVVSDQALSRHQASLASENLW